MIQRVQTIFIAIVAILMSIFISKPLWVKNVEDQFFALTPFNYKIFMIDNTIIKLEKFPYMAIGILSIFIILTSAINIFLYYSRRKQIIICKIISYSLFFLTILIGILSREIFKIIGHLNYRDVNITLLLPILSMISNAIALRFIKKDEELVRSSNRLR